MTDSIVQRERHIIKSEVLRTERISIIGQHQHQRVKQFDCHEDVGSIKSNLCCVVNYWLDKF